jgi:EpsI family protein
MSGLSARVIIVALAMIVASGIAAAMRPGERIADHRPRIDLEHMIPNQFGDWKTDTSMAPVRVSPEVQAKLDKLYDQTLSRTYVNSHGDRVMLSIAYGGDQSEAMQVHRPEVCYPAQGFAILKNLSALLSTRFGDVPVKRLVAVHGARVEPITYWITVGDEVALGGLDRKLAQVKYGLTGKVPDGLLFRVSSIDRDEARAYEIQSKFVRQLLDELDEAGQRRMLGALAS